MKVGLAAGDAPAGQKGMMPMQMMIRARAPDGADISIIDLEHKKPKRHHVTNSRNLRILYERTGA